MNNHVEEKPVTNIKRRDNHEGPKYHFITYAVSMVLTFLAFIAVLNETLNKNFVVFLILAMAVVQVVLQLAYWMHMKDRGHFYAITGLIVGTFVMFTCVIMAVYWVWW
ncbi:cytochrome C oxidase subunit IV family protein [Longirhabdus pacifica]|uniref:cytochrome C oxidase subunit IV family protein n=1 Tax=Longirhabdus pacifica TaxID=2305227 RepID=UPI001008C315|nr:cytochrome C oxidase subunit IV family protein [Longirhabdus pacifica]